MAEGLNRVMLMGNLGADPELRYTQSGRAVLNMRLATTESFVDRDGQRKDRTEWHNVAIWGKRAEALSKFLNKGSSIFVEGSIRYSSYEGQDGQKRYKTEINARNILFTGSRGGGGGGRDYGSSSNFDQPQSTGFNDTPPPSYGTGGGGSAGGGGGGQAPPQQAAQGGFGPDDDDDDIPF